MTSSDLRNHLLGNCACPLLLFLPARVILSSLLSTHTSQKRKLCSVAENGRVLDLRAVTSNIPANDNNATASSNRLQSTTALLMLIKRCFPWKCPLTSMGPPDDAVVCACHRCSCCTQSKGSREIDNIGIIEKCEDVYGRF
ncbi:hypothetical protein T05_2393 [Trichinella murrelli]|uniref:Uncharacterized protein n=1 Tax=Trichinella murrelli TaxID=144512 RepID=A0A0V0SYG5_9BILA|nr:hypothetical protein T05_2393 [Trichinella murrelli]